MNYHLVPNWSESVTETYEFRTTVFTSHSGQEQRVAERLTPRRTVSFSTLLWDERLLAFKALMHSRGAETITIPDPARYASVLLVDAPIGASTIIVSSVAWLAEGTQLSISNFDTTEFFGAEDLVAVGSFSLSFNDDFENGSQRFQVTLADPLTRAWSAGAVLRPAVVGRLAQSVTLNHLTDDKATGSISLRIMPPSAAPVLSAASLTTFNGRPVLLAKPNWAQTPTVTFSTPFEEVDYDRGVIATFLPIEFYTKITQFTYTDRSKDDLGSVLKLFNAMRGRQGEFYCPSWTTDMLPSGGIPNGSVHLTVVGSRVAETYSGSTVENAIAIRLSDGSWIFRKVLAIEETEEGGPGAFSLDYDPSFDGAAVGMFSKLTLDVAVSQDLYQRDIVMICWLNVCRFAADALTIRWFTDEVGQAVVQVMTLEALTAE